MHPEDSKRVFCVKFVSILFVVLLAFPSLIGMMNPTKGDTSIMQDTDKDLKAGTTGSTTEVNGTGADAVVKLLKHDTWGVAASKGYMEKIADPAMAYDTDNGLILEFGGYSYSTWNYVDTTMIYNATNLTWYNPNPAVKPPARGYPMMTYDQKDKVFVMLGGYNWAASVCPGGYCADVWAYNITNNTWFKLAPTGLGGGYGGALTYDPITALVVLYGGYFTSVTGYLQNVVVYNYTTNTWTTRAIPSPSPAGRYGPGLIYNPNNGTLLMFAGYESAASQKNDTWQYNVSSSTWTKYNPAIVPPSLYSPMMTWDGRLKAAFFIGGYSNTLGYLNQTWTFDPKTVTWTRLFPSKSPAGCSGGGLVYNEKESVDIMFGPYYNLIGATNQTWYYGSLFYEKGEFISGSIDSKPDQTTVNWINMSMSATLNNGNITYQVSATDDNTSWYFVGWDGTAQTFYTKLDGQNLWTGLDGHRYLKYKLYLKSFDPIRSPEIGNVTVLFNRPSLAPVLKSPKHFDYVTSDTPTFELSAMDWDTKDKLVYSIELSLDNFNTVSKTYDMTQSSAGWSATSYAPGEMATFTLPDTEKLTNGKTYQWRARAFDGRDWSTVSVIWWFSVDTTPPEAPYSVNDGLGDDIDFTSSQDTLAAHWDSAGDPESGILAYWYSIGTTPGGIQVLNFTENGIRTAVTVHGLTLASGKTYYVSVKAENGAGLFSSVVTSDGVTVDTTGPTMPIVKDDGNYTNSKTELSAQWFSADPESGVVENMYALGTSAGATDVVNWTSIGGANTITYSGLNLVEGTTYYISVKTMNSLGGWSLIGSSDGITVDTNPPYDIKLGLGGTNGYTGSNKVIMSIDAKDNVSGVSDMQFSNDGSIWSGWAPFAKSQEWPLSPGDGLKTVYVRVKDKAGNVGMIVTATVTLDTLAPSSLSVSINDGAKLTNSTKLQLTFGATDLTSGVSDMALSENGVTWGNWMPYTSKMSYTLSADNGMRQIYFKVKDKASNIADPTNNSIMLDTLAPTEVSVVINDNDPITMDAQVNLKLAAKDATSGVTSMSFSDDGTVWTAWEPFATTKTWSLKGAIGVKTVWVRVMDKAGNTAPTTKDSIAYGESPMSLVITHPVKATTVSGTIKISGSAKSDTPVSKVQVRIDGGVWKDASGNENWTYDWNTKDYPDGIHTIEVQAKDSLGYTISNPTEVHIKNVASKPVGLSTGDVVNYLILAIVLILVVVCIMFYVLSRKIRTPPEREPMEHTSNIDYEAQEHPRTPPRQTAPANTGHQHPREVVKMRAPTKTPETVPVVARDIPADRPGPPAQSTRTDLKPQQDETEAPVTDEGTGDKKDSGSLKSILQKLD